MAWALVAFIVASFIVVLYRAYRRLTGAVYHPGSVRALAETQPDAFDSAELLDQSTSTHWAMPNDISLYHTSPTTQPPSSSSSTAHHVLAVSGGPGVAVSSPWKVFEDTLFKDSSEMHVHHFHARGCGRSTVPIDAFPAAGGPFPGICTVEEALGLGVQLSDVERIRRRLVHGLSSVGSHRLSLVGHSFGAFIATLYATEFPEHVRALVLLAPANVLSIPPSKKDHDCDYFECIRSRLDSDEQRAEFDKIKPKLFDFRSLPAMRERDMQALQREILDWYLTADPDSKQFCDARTDDIGGWMAMASYFSFGMRADYRAALKDRLKTCKFPVLIVGGKRDISNMKKVCGKYEALFPKGTVKRVELDTGHFMQEEKPEELAKIIHDFVERS